jgi:release factor glutamine methyltransferase
VTILLDGIAGATLWAASWLARGHALPRPVRIAATNIFRRVDPLQTTFAGLELSVGTDVFFPQPVSETLVDAAFEKIALEEHAHVIDVGTGCGAVALAIARARPGADVWGIDISERALHWARRNRKALDVRNVSFVRGSLLDPIPRGSRGHVRVVTANVPYVRRREKMSDGRPGIPRGSVFGADDDGLGLVRALAREAVDVLEPGGRLAIQVADEQWDSLACDLAALGFQPQQQPRRRPGRAVVCWADKPE